MVRVEVQVGVSNDKFPHCISYSTLPLRLLPDIAPPTGHSVPGRNDIYFESTV